MEIRNAFGFRVVSDCYNANPSSTRMALQTIGNLSNANHRIAVLGDMLELGTDASKLHFEIGQMIPENNFDLLLTIGKYSKEIRKGAISRGLRREKADHPVQPKLAEAVVQTYEAGAFDPLRDPCR